MTIAYAMSFADGPFYTSAINDFRCMNPNDNFPYPQYLEEFPGGYGESKTTDTVGEPYGRTDHAKSNNGPTPGWSCYDTTPFGALGDISTAFSGATLSPNHVSMRSPLSTFSRTSPEVISRTGHHASLEAHSRASSPRKSRSTYSDDVLLQDDKDFQPPTSSRKRGRPRQLHTTSSASSEEASQLRSPQRASCVPHKQIERKYREGLNMEFERLRRAVPTLPQCTDANVIGATKPSKGMVLAAAIDYIGRVEREREAALEEIERLGGSFRTTKLSASQADRRMF